MANFDFKVGLAIVLFAILNLLVLSLKSVYVPGETAFGFYVPLQDGTVLSYQYDTKTKNKILPLIIWATDFANDAWSRTALTWDYSVDMFLQSNFFADNATYLFVAKRDVVDLELFRTAVFSRASTLGIDPINLKRLLFANDTFYSEKFKSTAPILVDNLNQWTSTTSRMNIYYPNPTNSSQSLVLNISRLDCYWPNCGTSMPSSPTQLLDVGDACGNISIAVKGKVVMGTANFCSYEKAAMNVYSHGGIAALVVMRESEKVTLQINTAGDVYIPIFTTSIHFSDGMRLKALLAAASTSAVARVVTIKIYSQVVSGNFLVIDAAGQLQEIGSTINADLRLASWAAQYEVYLQRLDRQLSTGAYIVPLFQGRILSAESNALTISKDILQRYSKLQVETAITCPGQADSDCSSWDHCITIAFRCAAEGSYATHMEFSDQRIHKLSSQPLFYAHNEIFQKAYESSYLNLTLPLNNDLHRRLEVGGDARELVRYVTPFRRRNGHWLTDISPLVALLQQCDSNTYIFEATAGAYPWFLSSSLRFSEPYEASVTKWSAPPTRHTQGDSNLRNTLDKNKAGYYDNIPLRPSNFTTLFHFSEYFTRESNRNRTLLFHPPSNTKRVLLEAIITGHGEDSKTGCCEFLPSMHVFTINGIQFNLTFHDAGTNWGCADRAIDGSEPNEYGTWWYGRAGWCDGMDVKPWMVDVTKAIIDLEISAPNVLNYKALMMDTAGNWVEPPESQSGYFIVSSNLVYYDVYDVDDYSFLPQALQFLSNALFAFRAFWLTMMCCCCVFGMIFVKLILLCVCGAMKITERKGGQVAYRQLSAVEMVQPAAVNKHHHTLLPTDDLDSVVNPAHSSRPAAI